jgi:hypothetical protein
MFRLKPLLTKFRPKVQMFWRYPTRKFMNRHIYLPFMTQNTFKLNYYPLRFMSSEQKDAIDYMK